MPHTSARMAHTPSARLLTHSNSSEIANQSTCCTKTVRLSSRRMCKAAPGTRLTSAARVMNFAMSPMKRRTPIAGRTCWTTADRSRMQRSRPARSTPLRRQPWVMNPRTSHGGP